MNLKELKDFLIENGVMKDYYSLTGGLPNDAYCINYLDPGWEVYYCENGEKSFSKFFSKEGEACEYLYGLIVSDSVIKGTLRESHS